MTKRLQLGRALFYTRDSGGRYETSHSSHVEWAQANEQKLGLRFNGTPVIIEEMIRLGQFANGDVFLDYDVSGNVLSRPGLNGILDEAKRDLTVSHVFIPRRDRLARPNDATDGVRIETSCDA